MMHLFIWRVGLEYGKAVGWWDYWKSLPPAVARDHVAYLLGIGVDVETVGF